jgi:serine/threonine-protein kinase
LVDRGVSTVIDNRYQLVRELGVGGMGAVWEAEHVGIGRRVAVKLLHKSLLEKDTSMMSRLQREARLAGSLDSPHIATVLDTGIDRASGSPYLVMEYLVGEDLQTLIARAEKLPTELALKIAAQACLGLKKAHDAKIIHRDIKPANMYLARKDGEIVVKILDFGIAKLGPDQLATLDSAGLTRTGSLIGSPLFMSPEQARGMKTLDQRSDVWSLGVVLFNMLTGRTPYESIDALGELILAICSTVSPSVRDYSPEVPIEVAEIVQRALQIPPSERFQDAGQMFEALQSRIDDRTIREDALAGFPEAQPKSRRFVAPRPTGGTEIIASVSCIEDRASQESDPQVVAGSVSMTMATPLGSSARPEGDAAPAPSGATPAPTPPASSAKTSPTPLTDSVARSVASSGAGGASLHASSVGSDSADRDRARSKLPRLVAAAAALAVGAGVAWFVGAGASSTDKAPTQDAPSSAAVASVSPAEASAITVVASSDLARAPTSTAMTAETQSVLASASAAPAPSSQPAATAPGPRPRPGDPRVPPGPGTAKPVDTSGFGDRK